MPLCSRLNFNILGDAAWARYGVAKFAECLQMAFDRFADIPFRLFERTGCDAARESPDLPEGLTGGTDLTDTQEQAVDCLAEALTGRIARGEALPGLPRSSNGANIRSAFHFTRRPNWHSTWPCPLVCGKASGCEIRFGPGVRVRSALQQKFGYRTPIPPKCSKVKGRVTITPLGVDRDRIRGAGLIGKQGL